MLVSIQTAVARLAFEGKTLEQVKAAKPTAAWDAAWAGRIINGDFLVESVYAELRGT